MLTARVSPVLTTHHTWMANTSLHTDHDPMAGWPGINLQYLLGKVDLLSNHQEEGQCKVRNLQNWDQDHHLESAFLGPEFWDKKVSIKMCESEMSGSSSGYRMGETSSESPSPPHFQQQVIRYLSLGSHERCLCEGPVPPSWRCWW